MSSLSIAQIADVVAEHFGVSLVDLKSPRRCEPTVTARHVAIYLSRQLVPVGLPTIGAYFGDRDHSTVMHAVRRVRDEIRSSEAMRATVAGLHAALIVIANSRLAGAVGGVDALAYARSIALAPAREVMRASHVEIAAMAQRIVEAQAALEDAACLLRGLADPDIAGDEQTLAARAHRLAAGLEALGLIKIQQKDAA